MLRSLRDLLRRLWGMVRSITGHHRCSLVGTNAPGHQATNARGHHLVGTNALRHQGTTVTRLLEHSPCFITTCSTLLGSFRCIQGVVFHMVAT